MTQHRRLGLACRAAGVLEQCHVLCRDLRPLLRQGACTAGPQFIEPDERRVRGNGRCGNRRRSECGVVGDDQVIHGTVGPELLRHQRHEADIGRDQEARAGVGDLEKQLALGIERREVHDAPAALQHGEEHDRVHGRVGQVKRNGFAGAQAQVDQTRSSFLNGGPQFGIGDLAVAIFDRGLC